MTKKDLMANYPGSLPSFTDPASTDKLNSPSHSDQHIDANGEIVAIATELGVDPAGAYTTVSLRIAALEASGSGDLKADGTVPLTADWNVGLFDITAVEFKGALIGNASTVTNGVYTSDFPLNQDTTGKADTAGNSDTVTNGVYTTDFPLNQDTTGKADTAGNADTVTNATLTTALTVNTGAVTLTGNVGASVLTLGVGANSFSGTASGTNTGGNTGDNTVCTSGTATTAATLATARAINGVDFNGSAAITVTADANTLSNTTLKSTVVASSLTSLGTITSLVATTADINAGTFDGIVGGTTPSTGAFTTLSASGLITATGGQIKFPATAVPSADANTLDDYEEGTFTPIMVADTDDTWTYTTQTGTYTKIGNRVLFAIYVAWSNTAATGTMDIGSCLPFTAAATTNYHSVTVYNSGIVRTSDYYLQGYVTPSATSIDIFMSGPTGQEASLPVDTVGGLLVTGQYLVA